MSRYWARMSRASTAPVSSRSRSARVDFPWSMWAMMLRQRIRSSEVTIRPLSLIRVACSGTRLLFGTCPRRVVVVGSANVDLVWHGERLPRPGETVTDGEFVQVLGGKGANQAAAAAALGAEVVLRRLRRRRRARPPGARRSRGARHRLFARSRSPRAAPTGVALITVDAQGENAIAVAPGANRLGARRRRGGRDPAPATSCCARSRSRSRPSRPRSRGRGRVRRVADREPGAAARRARGRGAHAERARVRAPRRRRTRCSPRAPAVDRDAGRGGRGAAPRRAATRSNKRRSRSTRRHDRRGRRVQRRARVGVADGDRSRTRCRSRARPPRSRRARSARAARSRPRPRSTRCRDRLTDQLEHGSRVDAPRHLDRPAATRRSITVMPRVWVPSSSMRTRWSRSRTARDG